MTENTTTTEGSMGHDHRAVRALRAGFHGSSEARADTDLMLVDGSLSYAPRFVELDRNDVSVNVETVLDLAEYNRRAHARREARAEAARRAERRARRRDLVGVILLAALILTLILAVGRALIATPTASAAVPAAWPWAAALPMATDVREAPELAPEVAGALEWWAKRGVTGCPAGVRAFVANDLDAAGAGGDCTIALPAAIFDREPPPAWDRCVVELHALGHALGLGHDETHPVMRQFPPAPVYCHPARQAKVRATLTPPLRRWIRHHSRGHISFEPGLVDDYVGGPSLLEQAVTAARSSAARLQALDVNAGLVFTVSGCELVAPRRFDCPVTATDEAGRYAGEAVLHVSDALIRKRRRGHWVGPWRPTGRLAVTGVDDGGARDPAVSA